MVTHTGRCDLGVQGPRGCFCHLRDERESCRGRGASIMLQLQGSGSDKKVTGEKQAELGEADEVTSTLSH